MVKVLARMPASQTGVLEYDPWSWFPIPVSCLCRFQEATGQLVKAVWFLQPMWETWIQFLVQPADIWRKEPTDGNSLSLYVCHIKKKKNGLGDRDEFTAKAEEGRNGR